MKNFEIQLKLDQQLFTLQVQELVPWPDADGFIRYAVSGKNRRSVIAVHERLCRKPLVLTEHDAWNELEQVLYPEAPSVYGEDMSYNWDEQQAIGRAIGNYLKRFKS